MNACVRVHTIWYVVGRVLRQRWPLLVFLFLTDGSSHLKNSHTFFLMVIVLDLGRVIVHLGSQRFFSQSLYV